MISIVIYVMVLSLFFSKLYLSRGSRPVALTTQESLGGTQLIEVRRVKRRPTNVAGYKRQRGHYARLPLTLIT